MAYEFQLQDPGEGIHEAEIIEVVVSKGDHVAEGDNVLVVETDKAAVDIPSPVAGDIVDIRVSEGDIARVGDVLMLIDTGEEAESGEAEGEKSEEDESSSGEDAGDETPAQEEGSSTEKDESEEKAETRKDDKEAEAEEPEAENNQAAADKKAEDTDKDNHGYGNEPQRHEKEDVRTRATPTVRKLAKDLGVDLASISGSGEDGRILEEDVRNAGESGEEKKTPRSDDAGEFEVVELSSVKRAMAKRMQRAWSDIPHVVHHDEIDITRLEDVRSRHNEDANEEGELTLTPFLIKALAGTLREHPHFNAAFDGEKMELRQFAAVNMGVALDTERGLLVPVLRDADRKSVVALSAELRELADRIRSDGARGEALKGATFTLTNIGSIGGTGFSPIISPPQVAIFGAARSRLQQVISGTPKDNEAHIALILPVCVAFDHRVIDGAEAARFMNAVKALLADPVELMLHS